MLSYATNKWRALKINVLFLSGKQGILGVGGKNQTHTPTHTPPSPPEVEGCKRHEDERFGNTDLSRFCSVHHMLTTLFFPIVAPLDNCWSEVVYMQLSSGTAVCQYSHFWKEQETPFWKHSSICPCSKSAALCTSGFQGISWAFAKGKCWHVLKVTAWNMFLAPTVKHQIEIVTYTVARN